MVVGLRAQTGYADAFLEIGTSPRSIALGQAVAALPQHAPGYVVNPAATGTIRQREIYGMGVSQFGMADYISLGFTAPAGDTWHWSLHGVGLQVDNIPDRPDLLGIQNQQARRDSVRAWTARGFDTFRDREIALTFNLSRAWHPIIDLGWQITPFPVSIPMGANVKIINKHLHTIRAAGIGVDLGMMLQVELSDILLLDWLGSLTWGGALTNIAGTRIYWNTDRGDLIPMQRISGWRYVQTLASFPVNVSIYRQTNTLYPHEIQSSVELELFRHIALRAGMQNESLQGGLGIQFPVAQHIVSIDYSFANHALGNAHRLGGSITFPP